jgi:hypothetical protein
LILSQKKGGLIGLISAIVLIAAIGSLPIIEYFNYTFLITALNNYWLKFIVPVSIIIIQAIWFQRVIHHSRFFEQWSYIPLIIFICAALALPGQLFTWDTLILNFIWLIFYQKLFYQHDDVVSNTQVFMDMGILLCIGAFIYPKSIYLLPFLYILLNQFTASDLNKFNIVLVSIIMVAFTTVGIGYFFISPEWVMQIPQSLAISIDFTSIFRPGLLYTYVVLLSIVLVLIPVMFRQLSFMQTKNRTVINMLFLQIITVLILGIISGADVFKSLHLLLLPISFLVSFGIYHIKRRWLTNIGLLFALFALVLIQWIYLRS